MYAYKMYVYNERLLTWTELTANDVNFKVLRVDGLNPPSATINTSTCGTIDGSFFNSARLDQRNIVITVLPRGNIESARLRLYRLFPVNQEVRLRFKNASRDVTINGYVESFEGSLCDFPQTFTISILCPRPYFDSHTVNTITLPAPHPDAATLPNQGDVKNGVTMRIEISQDLSGDAVRDLTITNTFTGEYMGFTAGLIHDDVIIISTIAGELKAELHRNNIAYTINLIAYMSSGSSWFKLAFEANRFTYSTSNNTDQYVSIQISHVDQYAGV